MVKIGDVSYRPLDYAQVSGAPRRSREGRRDEHS